MVKLSKTGAKQWDKTIGGDQNDDLNCLLELKPNQYVLAGSSYSGKKGDKTDTSRGQNDGWLVYLTYDTATSTLTTAATPQVQAAKPALDPNTFSVYPNPAKGTLHVQVSGNATVALMDQSGKVILSRKIDNYAAIDVSNLSNGVYYLINNATKEKQKVLITN